MLIQALSAAASNVTFRVASGPNNPLFQTVSTLFNEVIKPIYGDQTSALEKIEKGQDRTCEVLLSDAGVCLGVLVYKNQPVVEFPEAIDALELKTLFVVNPLENRGMGSKLMDRVKEVAINSELFKTIVVTVSEEKSESLAFFQRKGFAEAKKVPNMYKFGVTEYVLVYTLR